MRNFKSCAPLSKSLLLMMAFRDGCKEDSALAIISLDTVTVAIWAKFLMHNSNNRV